MNETKAHTLRTCAEVFLNTWPFVKHLSSLGEIRFTGSYALDTMTWPDIDLELNPFSTTLTPRNIFANLAALLFADPRVNKVDYRNFSDHIKLGMTKGYFLGISVYDESLRPFNCTIGPYWKIDLWILDDPETSRLFIKELFSKMTPRHKALIMHYKNMWTKIYGRPPQMASYFLYQAVVFEELKEEAEILDYLRKKHVKIE